MSFSYEWDEQYSQGSHLAVWPFTDLVAYVCRHAHPKNGFNRVLELGCGAGANIRFFQELGCDYSAVEGSPHIIEVLKKEYPEYEDKICLADFTKEIPFSASFDLVIDRSSLTCNSTEDILNCLKMVSEKMRKGGKFIGIDWHSKKDPLSEKGEYIDPFTRTNIEEGYLINTGRAHFSNQEHLEDIFSKTGFSLERLEHKSYLLEIPKREGPVASWNLVATKK